MKQNFVFVFIVYCYSGYTAYKKRQFLLYEISSLFCRSVTLAGYTDVESRIVISERNYRTY